MYNKDIIKKGEKKMNIKELENWEYLEELEELDEIIKKLDEYEHVIGYSEEITDEDLKTYQGYYWN